MAESPDRVRVNGNRHYDFEWGTPPSVTTITGLYEPKQEALKGFEDAVGKERAEEIKNKTALRGTLVHHRILNDLAMRQLPAPEVDFDVVYDGLEAEIKTCEAMWDDLDYPAGDDPYVEERVWSKEHGYAGTLDLLTDDGIVTDLKTSKPKPKGWAPSDSQFMQVSAYYKAAEELPKLPDPNGAAVVVLHPEPENNPELTARVERLSPTDVDEYFDEFLRLLSKYRS